MGSKLVDVEKNAGVWFMDCFYGAATIILNALPAIEMEDGLQYAQDVYARIRSYMIQ